MTTPDLTGSARTSEQIVKLVAAAFDVTPEDIQGGSRCRHVVLARHATYLVLRERPSWPMGTQRTLAQIAKAIGRSKVCGIAAGINAAREHAKTHPVFAQTIANLICI